MLIEFKGKTVIITGGSRGIGYANSIAFAKAGASIVVNHLDTQADKEGYESLKSELGKNNSRCISVEGNITDSNVCDTICKTAVDNFGGIDIVVNSAGFTKPVTTIETSDELWNNGINVNLSGAFYIARSALKYMIPKKSGRIIFIGSAGSISGGGGAPFYSAAKAGINGLVRFMSKDLAPEGITVNAVLPALIETDILKTRYQDPEKKNELLSRLPVGRLGQPEDIANTVLFLASEQAGFICGQNIIVDGGSTYK